MTIIFNHYGEPIVIAGILDVVASYLNIRVSFSKTMLNNLELLDVSNYSFDVVNPDEAFDYEVVSVRPEPIVENPMYVDLTITDCTNGKNYEIIITPDKLQAADLEYISSGYNTFTYTGVSELPEILLVEAVSETQVRVIFSKTMSINDDIKNKLKYSFNNNLKVLSLELESTSSILLTTTAQLPGQIYELTVI